MNKNIHEIMNSVFRRNLLPQTILSILPLTLFFPVGIIYTGILLFTLSLLLSGDYRMKWLTVKESPLFWPILGLSAITCCAAILLERPQGSFWSGFVHYQIYIFLLLFISVGSGDWQKRAVRVFFVGALYAATLYYLNLLQMLPKVDIFASYLDYKGNKSILLAILLAIAAGWMLYEIVSLPDRRSLWLKVLAFLYVVIALLFLAKSRTASLIFILLCLLFFLKYFIMSWRSVLWSLSFVSILAVAWLSASNLGQRVIGTVEDVKSFSQGQHISDDGIRLEMFSITSKIISEKPWAGHGIATFPSQYQKYAKGLFSEGTQTPHNDYLFYSAEIGLIGLAALLWIWLTQLTVAWKIGGAPGMWLGMLGVAMMIGGMFNAILRDAVFGMPFMILLAIPLAGVTRNHVRAV
ncbi:MAG: O-antigen ligase family protein [Candidatus Nitrotoga sp.]|nr:O-antigen ligase family protein [Candidatus Nitrotoga sp.]